MLETWLEHRCVPRIKLNETREIRKRFPFQRLHRNIHRDIRRVIGRREEIKKKRRHRVIARGMIPPP